MIVRVDLKAVVTPFGREVLRRVPLAEPGLSLWAFVMVPEPLDGVFERHPGRSFEDVLTVPVFVKLIAGAFLQHRENGRQVLEHARENETLLTSVEAAYGMLRRVPVSLSEGLLEEGTARLHKLPSSGDCVREWPASLREFAPAIVDGKKLKQVAQRLRAARGQAAMLFGGKPLGGLCAHRGLTRSRPIVTAMPTDAELDSSRAASHRGNAAVVSESAVL